MILRRFLFGLFLLAFQWNKTSGTQSGDPNPEVNCETLPDSYTRTSVTGETNVSIVNLLNGGLGETSNLLSTSNSWPEDVILIMGNTGSGKTTLTQILTTNLTRIHLKQTRSGNLVIVDDDEKIGAPSTTSRTLIPELVSIPGGNNTTIHFYDCPGYDDTRGPEQDLAANFFMNQIIQNVKRIKILFLVRHPSVQLGNDRLDFDLLAQHATTFVKNMTAFENSIALVVTKVNSFNEKGSKISDNQIIERTIEFLKCYQKALEEKLDSPNVNERERAKLSSKLDFVRILLQPDKIQFSRSPTQCGPLSEDPEVQNTKTYVTKLYENLEYSPVDNTTNFGYTLKDKTVLSIQNFTLAINQVIKGKVENFTQTFWKWLDQGYNNLLKKDINKLLHFIRRTKPRVENLGQKVSAANVSNSLENLAGVLLQEFSEMGYNHSDNSKFSEFMKGQEEYLKFFEEVTQTPINRVLNDWLYPISKLQENYRKTLDGVLVQLARSLNDDVEKNVRQNIKRFTTWFFRQADFKTDVASLLELVQQSQKPIQNLTNLVSTSPQKLANEIKQYLQAVNYTVDSHFSLHELEAQFSVLDDIAGHKAYRKAEQWRLPIKEFTKPYNTWFTNTTENLVHTINTKITNAVKNLKKRFLEFFERKTFTEMENIAKLETELERYSTAFHKLDIVEKESAKQLGLVLNDTVTKLGFSVSPKFAPILEANGNYLTILDSLLDRVALRDTENWWKPILKFQEGLRSYLTWYQFCGEVQRKMSTHAWQSNDKLRLSTNLGTDTLDFLKRNKIVVISSEIQAIKTRLDVKHVQNLDHTVRWYLVTEQSQCQGDTLRVTGNTVRFSYFLNSQGNLAVCGRATKIKVYAADTVYLDTNINAVGREILVSLIAPRWDVIGSRHIALDGENNLDDYDKLCPDGHPGQPGGPAGSFFGRAGEIIGASRVTISVVGGKGGRGQNGCKGADGEDATTRYEEHDFKNFVVYWSVNQCIVGFPGGSGNRGGHGGAGGLGGNSGAVDFLPREYATQMTVRTGAGAMGKGGSGGEGGRGGKGSEGRCCYKRGAMGTRQENCEDWHRQPDGNSGERGQNGSNTKGQERPRQSKSLVGFGGVGEYKMVYGGKGNLVTRAFIASLE